jgi:response regulator NasT
MTAGPKPLSILVIDENRLRASIIEAGLREAGYTHLTIVHGVSGIARRIAEFAPDVIVIDLGNPNRDMLENMFQLSRAVKRPIAMFVDRSDKAAIEAAVEAGVSAYVVDGLKQERVKPILDMAISRFNAFSRMTRELEDARSELESRKLVDRAKGILMSTRGLSEPQAYALLRKTAMNQNRKISEIAESLITAARLLAPPDEEL